MDRSGSSGSAARVERLFSVKSFWIRSSASITDTPSAAGYPPLFRRFSHQQVVEDDGEE
jgi:hypothetical protein